MRGLSGIMKQITQKEIFQMQKTWLRIPAGMRRTSWLITNEAEELNSGVPRNTELQIVVREGLEPGTSGFQAETSLRRKRFHGVSAPKSRFP